jgi:hypothetical protein
MLQKDKAVQNKMKADGLTLPQMMRIVQEELVSSREVDNGMLGTRNIGLDENLRSRIAAQRLDDVVAGRAPAPGEKPLDSQSEPSDKPGPKPGDIRPPAFTTEQQVAIPEMAGTMSEFGLSIKDGVSANELRTFIEMYAESAKTPEGRQLAADYLAETEKPIAQQRLIPKLHGALIESQMRLESQSGSAENGNVGVGGLNGSDGSRSAGGLSTGSSLGEGTAGDASRAKAANENAPRGLERAELPFEQVRLTLERLHELQSSKNLTPDEQFQLEALKAFKAHIMDAGVRDAVATNSRAISASGGGLGVSAIAVLAVMGWYKQRDAEEKEEPS